jgi:RNA polymerase sigma factor (TIGR02999 family)
MSEVTQILNRIEAGDQGASARLLPIVYDELRRLATVKLANEKPGQTLQATALVHDAYVRLVGDDQEKHWDSRGHFFSAAAEAMRRILIDQARKKASSKRGADFTRIALDSAQIASVVSPEALLRINEAMEKLATQKPQVFQLVNLRYFAGMSIEEAAQSLGIPSRNAYRHWTYARAWLSKELLAND